MIFESIRHIVAKDAFVEKVQILIRLVEVFAERNRMNIDFVTESTSEIDKKLQQMGIIESPTDYPELAKLLKEDFTKLLSCISFSIQNKAIIGNLIDKLDNSKRAELQAKEAVSKKPTFVDFFCGAGGLSCGFVQAGCKVVFANDFEEVCIRTYRYNHPELPSDKVLHGDIRNIIDNINDFVSGDIDFVVGGPPCQGFSSANQQRIIDDPRNELYKYFVKAITAILPKFVVMENVKGMLTVANQVVEDYKNICGEYKGANVNYLVSYRLLNSVDFGVSQSRERLIYIAIRSDIAEKQKITPETIFEEITQKISGNKVHLLREALEYIKPLDAPRIKNCNEIDDEKTGKKIDVNLFEGNENEYLRLINGGRTIPFVYNHKARFLNDINYEIYKKLNQGDDASDSKIEDIMPYKHRLYCFKDKYYKLIADRPSRTITAHLKMDCHSHIHPFQIRALTPREAARCQSFPDDYLFLGAYLKTYMQIGNAVPCIMAKVIAETIKKYL